MMKKLFIILILLTACNFSDNKQYIPVLQEEKSYGMVNFAFYNLTEFPEEIAEHSEEIDTLILAYNKIQEVPEYIGKLKRLKYLNISHNNLKTLPYSAGALPELTFMNVSYNLIDTLPMELSALRMLKKLKLNNNKLRHIPEFLIGTLNLNYLDISNNEIKVLNKPLIRNLEYLEELNLAGNNISGLFVLDSSIISNKVKKVNFSDNKIQAFILSLPLNNVEELDLSNNYIFFFNSIGVYDKVKKLDISRNKLNKLKDVWYNFPNLKILHLNGNQLYSLPKSFVALQNLDSLDLSYNNFSYIPIELLSLKKLKYLNLAGNKIPDKIIKWLKQELPNTKIEYERGYGIKKQNRKTDKENLAFPTQISGNDSSISE